MDLLVLGANGLLGSNVVANALERSQSAVATYRTNPPEFDVESAKLDVTDDDRFSELLDEYDPDTVINCAAMTDVDACERLPERAHGINGEAPGRLCPLTADRDVRFAQVSTDYVFDGRAETPYDEAASTDPVQVYGESKLRGEQAAHENDPDVLIPRLSFVYGRRGDTGTLHGFPAWVSEQLQNGETVSLFTDQFVTPTRAARAAETILDLVEADVSGTVHLASRSCVTPYDIGVEVADLLGHGDTVLTESSTEELERDAQRPSYTCLDTSRVESLLGREQPTLRDDLRIALQSIR